MAERVGFEPTVRQRRTLDFESGDNITQKPESKAQRGSRLYASYLECIRLRGLWLKMQSFGRKCSQI